MRISRVRRGRRAGLPVIAAALTVATLAAGCGSSDDSGTDTSAATPAGTTAAASGKEATGTPIKLMVAADITNPQGGVVNDGLSEGVKAGAKTLNAQGGVDGHPIVVEPCDLQGVPDNAARCARQAVEDKAAAVIEFSSVGQEKFSPILEPADIPLFPAYAIAPAELTEKNSFPLISGSLLSMSAGIVAGEGGCQKPTIVAQATPAAEFLKGLTDVGLRSLGKPESRLVTSPLGATDWAPIAAKATGDGTDCIVPNVNESINLALYPALMQDGFNGKIAGQAGSVYSDKLLKDFAPLLEGAHIADGSFPVSDDKWKPLRDAFDQYVDPSIHSRALASNIVKGGWVDLMAFTDAANRIADTGQEVTGKAVLDQLNKTTDLDTNGLLPPIDLTKEFDVKGFERLFNRNILKETINGGKVVVEGDWVDVSDNIRKGSAG
jgi:hypothetical protein